MWATVPNKIKEEERKIKVCTGSKNLFAYRLLIRKFKNFKSDKVDKWKIKILLLHLHLKPQVPCHYMVNIHPNGQFENRYVGFHYKKKT